MGYPVINLGVGAQGIWFFTFVSPENLEERHTEINAMTAALSSVLLRVKQSIISTY